MAHLERRCKVRYHAVRASQLLLTALQITAFVSILRAGAAAAVLRRTSKPLTAQANSSNGVVAHRLRGRQWQRQKRERHKRHHGERTLSQAGSASAGVEAGHKEARVSSPRDKRVAQTLGMYPHTIGCGRFTFASAVSSIMRVPVQGEGAWADRNEMTMGSCSHSTTRGCSPTPLPAQYSVLSYASTCVPFLQQPAATVLCQQ